MRLSIARFCLLLTTCLFTLSASFAQDKAPANVAGTNPRVRVVTTAGSFVVELDRTRAPLTVEAFLGYVNSGFYAGTIFHRVVAGFVAQAGGYTKDFQPKAVTANVHNESGNGLSNLRGTVGFARSNEPHSGTSQFYVNLADNLDLNPRATRWGYAVFGKVVEGMEVVDEIGHRPTGPGGPFDRSVPVEAVVIEKIETLP
jgi:cyclophilin family peptidyl-prolyl cis-trans isomerase